AQKRPAAILDLVRTLMTAAPLCDRVEQRNAYIVGKGKTDERPRQLETARQSEMRALMGQQPVKFLAGKTHRALLVAQRAADAIHKCTLAGSIGPDQPEPLAGRDCERNIFKRDEAAEALAQTVDSQKHLRRSALCGGVICAAEIRRAHGTFPGISASTRRRPTKSSGFRGKKIWPSPTMPFGAITTKMTRRQPTIRRLTADEIVTVAICCNDPSSNAPISGPTQLVVPPINGMAMELTA